MYQVGDQIVYGVHGVCCVTAEEERTVDRKHVTYLVLEPVGQDGSRYLVPTHNASAMAKLRPILTREGIEEILSDPGAKTEGWIQDENQRKQVYRELIASGDCKRLFRMVCLLHRHKESQQAAGKKCHLCDENFLRDAERLLSGEFALVLGMAPEQVRQFVLERLK